MWTNQGIIPSPGAARFPALAGDREADVVVVGAGIAGLTAAALLVRGGASVAVLEGSTVGCGTSGRTTAKVTALQGLRYRTLTRLHGTDAAARYATAQIAALDWMADEVAAGGIGCDWARRPALTYASDAESRRLVEEEHGASRAAGLATDLVEDAGLPFGTAGAVRLDDQAQFDPYPYLLALASEISAGDGGAVYEQSRVSAIRGHRSHRVVTAAGTIRAEHVVVATLLPVTDRGAFFARAEPKCSYSLVLRVDGSRPEGMYLSAGSPTRSMRTVGPDDENLLLVAGNGHVVGRRSPTIAEYDDLLAWARQHFAVEEVVARWSAHDYETADHLPWAGPVSPATPQVQVAGGFEKWGMTNATAAAMVISDRILGLNDQPSAAWADLFKPMRLGAHAAASTARINVGVAAQMLQGWARPDAPSGPAGDGRRHRDGLKPAGDAQGFTGSVVCTHLGGPCRWNDAEATWDCPLHGSRFAADGTVVTAPATRPLERRSGAPAG